MKKRVLIFILLTMPIWTHQTARANTVYNSHCLNQIAPGPQIEELTIQTLSSIQQNHSDTIVSSLINIDLVSLENRIKNEVQYAEQLNTALLSYEKELENGRKRFWQVTRPNINKLVQQIQSLLSVYEKHLLETKTINQILSSYKITLQVAKSVIENELSLVEQVPTSDTHRIAVSHKIAQQKNAHSIMEKIDSLSIVLNQMDIQFKKLVDTQESNLTVNVANYKERTQLREYVERPYTSRPISKSTKQLPNDDRINNLKSQLLAANSKFSEYDISRLTDKYLEAAGEHIEIALIVRVTTLLDERISYLKKTSKYVNVFNGDKSIIQTMKGTIISRAITQLSSPMAEQLIKLVNANLESKEKAYILGHLSQENYLEKYAHVVHFLLSQHSFKVDFYYKNEVNAWVHLNGFINAIFKQNLIQSNYDFFKVTVDDLLLHNHFHTIMGAIMNDNNFFNTAHAQRWLLESQFFEYASKDQYPTSSTELFLKLAQIKEPHIKSRLLIQYLNSFINIKQKNKSEFIHLLPDIERFEQHVPDKVLQLFYLKAISGSLKIRYNVKFHQLFNGKSSINRRTFNRFMLFNLLKSIDPTYWNEMLSDLATTNNEGIKEFIRAKTGFNIFKMIFEKDPRLALSYNDTLIRFARMIPSVKKQLYLEYTQMSLDYLKEHPMVVNQNGKPILYEFLSDHCIPCLNNSTEIMISLIKLNDPVAFSLILMNQLKQTTPTQLQALIPHIVNKIQTESELLKLIEVIELKSIGMKYNDVFLLVKMALPEIDSTLQNHIFSQHYARSLPFMILSESLNIADSVHRLQFIKEKNEKYGIRADSINE